jgi:hypothetical protein
MQQLEATYRDRPVHAQRLRRATDEYLLRVRLIALTQARSDARRVDRTHDHDRPTPKAA